VLPKSHAASLSLNRNDLRSALERVGQFTESKTRCVVVEVSTNQLCVRAQDGAVGESEESLATSYAGEPARIGFNAAYLADFLNRAEHQNVRFLFNNADMATEWQPVSEAAAPDFRYVVMPMRIN
jgi:DNA polymerase-3 subunit beta